MTKQSNEEIEILKNKINRNLGSENLSKFNRNSCEGLTNMLYQIENRILAPENRVDELEN
jgi:hypothetical protein